MYKNILIISDNEYLCAQFNKILIDNASPDVNYTFAISPFSNKETFETLLRKDILVVNLKDDKTIDSIIKKFDLVFSIHCKQIFPPPLVNSIKCINIHP